MNDKPRVTTFAYSSAEAIDKLMVGDKVDFRILKAPFPTEEEAWGSSNAIDSSIVDLTGMPLSDYGLEDYEKVIKFHTYGIPQDLLEAWDLSMPGVPKRVMIVILDDETMISLELNGGDDFRYQSYPRNSIGAELGLMFAESLGGPW